MSHVPAGLLGDPVSRRAAVGIDITGVNLSYGRNHVLKDVSLQIRPGELFAFLGPSGCGKTTLLRLIAGFNQGDSGEVRIGGTEVSRLPPWKRDVGLVFQSYALWPHMTVARNVAFGLEERGIPRAEIRTRVAAALALVGLEELAGRRPAQLSGGQQQRVALARTIVVEPKVLLLDEPLSNLDAKLRIQVRRELRQLQQRLGLTTIFVTHDQEEANTICDRIAVIDRGVVQQVGTPLELYDRPANLFVASFLGTANILSGKRLATADGEIMRLEDIGDVPLPTGVAAGASLVLRPQNVRLLQPGEPQPSHGLLASGTVVNREFLGSTVRYAVRIGSAELLVEEPHFGGSRTYDVDSRIMVRLDLDQALFVAP